MDGVRTDVYPDGTRITQSVDKKEHTTVFADGSRVVRGHDGVILVAVAPGSSVLTQVDGDWQATVAVLGLVIWHADGTIEIRHPDQSTDFLKPDGTMTTVAADGSHQWLEGGNVISVSLDGTQTVLTPSGTVQQTNPDGTVLVQQGGTITRYETNGSTTVFSADGTIHRTEAGGVEFTWNPDGSRVTRYSESGLSLTTEFDGSSTVSLGNGLSFHLGNAGDVAVDGGNGIPPTLPGGGYEQSLPGGGSLRVQDGSILVCFPGGNKVQVFANGDRRETVRGVETSYCSNGDITQVEGSRKVAFDASEMSTRLYEGSTLKELVDYDGVIHRYELNHEYTTLTTGLVLQDGKSPFYQTADGQQPRIEVIRTPRGGADTPENQRLLALQRGGNRILFAPNTDPSHPETPDTSQGTGWSSMISRFAAGMSNGAANGSVGHDANGNPTTIDKNGTIYFLSASDNDGSWRVLYFDLEPGWVESSDSRKSIKILQRDLKATKLVDDQYGDVYYTLNVKYSSDNWKLLKCAEFPPAEKRAEAIPIPGKRLLLDIPFVVAPEPPDRPDMTSVILQRYRDILSTPVSPEHAEANEKVGWFDWAFKIPTKIAGWIRSAVVAVVEKAIQGIEALKIKSLSRLHELVGGMVEGIVGGIYSDMAGLFDISGALLKDALDPVGAFHETIVAKARKMAEKVVDTICKFTDRMQDDLVLRARSERYLNQFLENAPVLASGVMLQPGPVMLMGLFTALFLDSATTVRGYVAERAKKFENFDLPDAESWQLAGYFIGSCATNAALAVGGGVYGIGELIAAARGAKFAKFASTLTKYPSRGYTVVAIRSIAPEVAIAKQATAQAELSAALARVLRQDAAEGQKVIQEAIEAVGGSGASKKAAMAKVTEIVTTMKKGVQSVGDLGALARLVAEQGGNVADALRKATSATGFSTFLNSLEKLRTLDSVAERTARVNLAKVLQKAWECPENGAILGRAIREITKGQVANAALRTDRFLKQMAQLDVNGCAGLNKLVDKLRELAADSREWASVFGKNPVLDGAKMTSKSGPEMLISKLLTNEKTAPHGSIILSDFRKYADVQGSLRLIKCIATSTNLGYIRAGRLAAYLSTPEGIGRYGYRITRIEIRPKELVPRFLSSTVKCPSTGQSAYSRVLAVATQRPNEDALN